MGDWGEQGAQRSLLGMSSAFPASTTDNFMFLTQSIKGPQMTSPDQPAPQSSGAGASPPPPPLAHHSLESFLLVKHFISSITLWNHSCPGGMFSYILTHNLQPFPSLRPLPIVPPWWVGAPLK